VLGPSKETEMSTPNQNQNHPLNVETPMLAAFRGDGLGHHQPVFRGTPLAAECGDCAVSIKNIQVMLDAGLQVREALTEGHGRKVLVCFDSGEQYLATGFAYGGDMEANDEDKAKVRALARLLSRWFGREVESWLHDITYMDASCYTQSLTQLRDMPEPDHGGDDNYAPDAWHNGEQLRVVTVDSD
jgi:hypothetical protein